MSQTFQARLQSSGYPLDVILSQLRELHQLALDLGEEAQTLLKWLVP